MKAWREIALGGMFAAVAIWMLSLVWRFAIPRHDVVASLVGVGYAGSMLLGTYIMIRFALQRLKR